MTTPLTPPTFGDKYSVGLTDLGSGYAAGITSAGNSIAGAISSVMGGYNQRTGEVQPGILDQKKASEDNLDMLFYHGMIKKDEYEKAKTMGLGGQQKYIGQITSEFNAKLQAQYAMEQAKMSEGAAYARTQLSDTGATGRTNISEKGAADRQTQELAAKQKQFEEEQRSKNRTMVPNQVTNNGASIPPVIKLGQ